MDSIKGVLTQNWLVNFWWDMHQMKALHVWAPLHASPPHHRPHPKELEPKKVRQGKYGFHKRSVKLKLACKLLVGHASNESPTCVGPIACLSTIP